MQARDGAVIAELAQQLRKLPGDASNLVVSVGGNDALGEAALLECEGRLDGRGVRNTPACSTRSSPGVCRSPVCTTAPEAVLRRLAATALTAPNDAITREAFARGVDRIDLRIVCDEDADFANPIEPSRLGGAKIARAILGSGARDAHFARVAWPDRYCSRNAVC